ncbi:MAG: hypothetical protein LBT78_08570 [Tannerella sp.]|jgi:hypothetical protein|nr:hypothetical protein [Tannerella sp.]
MQHAEKPVAVRGNCSYIFARQRDGEKAILFEGNNHIPFFWLMLWGPEDIDFFYEKKNRLPQNEAEPAGIGLDKLKALVRAADRREYVKRYYVTCLPLYDDWLYFMQISDFSDMKIYVDLDDLCSCYDSPEHFTDSLRRAIACFDENREAWYENTIADTCGYDGRNRNKKRFSDLSEAYREMNQKDIYGRFDKKLHLGKKLSGGKKTGLTILALVFIALLLAGIAYFVTR